jgi:hypothetical protein
MGMNRRFQRYAARQATRKLTRAVPWLGAAIALLTLAGAIRRKGWFGGTLHTALDFTPVVGALKNLTELGLGRDLFRDRPGAQTPGRTDTCSFGRLERSGPWFSVR